MNEFAFAFHGADLRARASGVLWWPAAGTLCVSDLHLGKSGRIARRSGAMVPPYEMQDTLTRLEAEITATGARRVICLGDSFDDDRAAAELTGDTRLWLARLAAGRDWVWITGNHDPGPLDLPGSTRRDWQGDGLTFRHIAETGARAEISGHYHPKLRLSRRGAVVSRRCFLIDGARVVLPAFGTYTGGLATTDPALCAVMGPDALAVTTGKRVHVVPMPRAPAPAGMRPQPRGAA